MKTGFFLTARLGSTRLARKHLLEAAGRPLLSVLAGRIRRTFTAPIDRGEALVAVVASDEPANRDFERLGEGLRVFYGATHNIPLRHLQATQALGVDVIVAVDGDDILCSVEAMRVVRDALLRGAPYASTSGLPLGMNAFGYRTEFLARSVAGNEEKTLETGWTYIFDTSRLEKIALELGVAATESLRFTLDYAEDYEFFRRIVEHFGDAIDSASDREIVSFVTAERLQRITDPIAKKYWENFQSVRAKEMGRLDDNLGRYVSIGLRGSGPELWERAKKVIPGGNQLLSKRAERFLPGLWPAYYSRAQGCTVWDCLGNRYTDFAQMGVGSCVLGYADADVNAAVIDAISNGSMSSLNCSEEIQLAELLVALHPWAEMARFSRSGGEACSIAVRIARAATGRSKVAFCGYHGWHDWYLAANVADQTNLDGQLLPGLAPRGVPRELRQTALPFNYNRLDDLERIASEHGNNLAAIIMEPLRGNRPALGFLEGVRRIADRTGAALIFDEVTSGFRMNVGGIHLTLEVEPDIAVLGKALGNGFPISAIIGRRSVMDAAQESFISSTFWTERTGFVAALATVSKMQRENVPARLIHYGERLNAGWTRLAAESGLKIHIDGIAPLTHFSFQGGEPMVFETLYAQEMLAKDYLLGTAVYSTFAYNDAVIDRFLEDSAQAFGVMADAVRKGNARSLLRGLPIQVGFKRLT